MDWRKRIVELKRDFNLDNKEIVAIIQSEYGILVSDETVRYHGTRKFKKQEAKDVLVTAGKSKVLLLSDLHVPFHREDDILNIILKHRNEIDAIIFVGDSLDCEAISKFSKENRKPLIEEMITFYKFLKKIDKLTPNVKKILIWGNHEYRYVKYMADNQSEFNPLHSDNIIQEVASGFTHFDRPNKRKTVYPPLSDNFIVVNKWFYQYNDLIVAHPKNFSRIELRTVTNTVDHFIKRGFNFKVLYIGHTHKWGQTVHFGKVCGELGCLCIPMGYSDTGNVSYSPQEYGYALITFDNNEFNVNESRLYRLELEDGEKEWQSEIDQS